jgi:Rps23 Pro-64 3,4-dihydroxylase Tpa1-like proline 4-hydroxylase
VDASLDHAIIFTYKGEKMKVVPIGDPSLGILLYKNMLPKELGLVSRIEETIKLGSQDSEGIFKWSPAMVGDGEVYPDYRDCFDLKIGERQALLLTQKYRDFTKLFFEIKNNLDECIKDYQKKYNIVMEYMEAINFVKYGPGQHFQTHADHGFSYICTVSSVMYLNDEYEGGELYFPNFDLIIKPEYGDIVLFPSTFIYSHAALPVKSGTKYAAVTMFDYNDRAHKYNS